MAEHDSKPTAVSVSEREPKPRRQRGTGRIWQIGPIWYIQYYVHGRQVRETSRSDNRRIAERLLQRRLGEAAAGIHHEPRRLKYEDLRDAYLDYYVTSKKKSMRYGQDGRPRLDPVRRLDAFFAGYRASAIDSDVMRRFIAELQAKGKRDSTINRSLSSLRRMFNLAAKDKKLRDVPH